MDRHVSGKRLYVPLATALLLSAMLVSTVSAQSITGNYRLSSVHVQYIDVLRDTTGSAAVEDAGTTYEIMVSWPSTAAAAAGQGFSFPLAEFEPGDTVAAPETPDLLLTPEGLSAFPLGAINMTVRLDDALGTMTIPHHGSGTSSYPTTAILACSTFAVVADVSDNAIFALSATSVPNTADNSITWGFGIISSEIFAFFTAVDPTAAPSTWPKNWGMLAASYTSSAFDTVDTIVVTWAATDSSATDLGVDASGNLNRSLGVTVLDGSDDMVAHLQAVFTAAGLSPDFNIGTAPMFVPPGAAAEVGLPEDSVVSVNFAYVFDPFGDDEIPLSGDEPFQFTGYYFTQNMLAAFGGFEAAFINAKIAQETDSTALVAGIDSALTAMGATGALPATAAVITTDSVLFWMVQDITGGADVEDAFEDAVDRGIVFSIGLALALDVSMETGFTPDDSDHDVDITNLAAGGRLVFEVDNQCLPVIETQYVTVTFTNVDLAPLAIEPIGNSIPSEFALHGNYPNPFNPVTTFSFDLPEQTIVEVTIWNLLGQEIRTLHRGALPAGTHEVTFDGRDNSGASVPSGVYFYRLRTPKNVATKKMMLLK
ncbi:MAG: T9SS type A sorting domain-containing protein [Candidatus Marinimicrobia bacterium]|nr:T9SS type A sorting domain-containing protein [Candidatus Neomarinimicrobiota bacterium]